MKEFGGSLPIDLSVFEKVGEHLEEVRFTTAEEARDPYANAVRRFVKGTAVDTEKVGKMFFQLLCDDILPHLLRDNAVRILIDFDNAVDQTVDVLCKHVTNLHDVPPALVFSLDNVECAVVVAGREMIKEPEPIAVEGAGVHDKDRDVGDVWLQRGEKCVHAQKGEDIPYTRENKDFPATREVFRCNTLNKRRLADRRVQLRTQKVPPALLLHRRDFLKDAEIRTGIEKYAIEVVYNGAKILCCILLQLSQEMRDRRLLVRCVAKKTNINLVAEPPPRKKIGVTDEGTQVVEAFLQIFHRFPSCVKKSS